MQQANESAGQSEVRSPRRARTHVRLDIVLVLLIGVMAECAHFGWRDGRPILNADSAQYVDAAQALLSPDRAADFSLRKPGYPFMLAGLALLTGDMSWSPLALNHFLLGLLPLAAYGFAAVMLSRWAGWLAAILTIARLQTFVPSERIMSEAPYMFLLSFGLLAAVMAITRAPRAARAYLLSAGVLLAGAWLVRGVAIVPIAAVLACFAWIYRSEPRRILRLSLCLIVPLAGVALFECSLNYANQGRFRTSTGSFGLMMMMRTRHMQGLPMPQGDSARRALALLPERAPDDAYRASELDTWVARYRAIHDHGLDEWEMDALMRETALQIVAEHPFEFLRCSADIFGRHLLRRDDLRFDRHVPLAHRYPCVLHVTGADDPDFEWNWWTYWGLPHRSIEDSRRLALNMRTVAEVRAPFAHTEPLPTLRYLSMTPAVSNTARMLRELAPIWPGLALIVLVILGANRAGCALIALAYVLDAGLISLCCPSEMAAMRYQSIWMVTDTALTGALLVVPFRLVWSRLKTGEWCRLTRRFTGATLRPI